MNESFEALKQENIEEQEVIFGELKQPILLIRKKV